MFPKEQLFIIIPSYFTGTMWFVLLGHRVLNVIDMRLLSTVAFSLGSRMCACILVATFNALILIARLPFRHIAEPKKNLYRKTCIHRLMIFVTHILYRENFFFIFHSVSSNFMTFLLRAEKDQSTDPYPHKYTLTHTHNTQCRRACSTFYESWSFRIRSGFKLEKSQQTFDPLDYMKLADGTEKTSYSTDWNQDFRNRLLDIEIIAHQRQANIVQFLIWILYDTTHRINWLYISTCISK